MARETDTRVALVAGATGISGRAICEQLVEAGWSVHGMSRSGPDLPGVAPISADLTDSGSVRAALLDVRPTHIFVTAWMKMATEEDNIRVNGGMVRDLLAGLPDPSRVEHVALLTGLKHYLGPFEAFGTGAVRDTPFHEEEPRLDVPNFYYAQEDEMWASSRRYGFTWSVHRAHTIIGFAVGNLMNMGVTLAIQAALCRERGTAFRFPGNETQWNGLTDMTEVQMLAKQMIWAATTPAAANQAFNCASGDVFRWRWMWPRIAAMLNVEPEGYLDAPQTLTANFDNSSSVEDWRSIAHAHGLAVDDVTLLASWWHTDSDMNRPVEKLTDMAASRRLGFLEQVVTVDAFESLFDRLRDEKIIPR